MGMGGLPQLPDTMFQAVDMPMFKAPVSPSPAMFKAAPPGKASAAVPSSEGAIDFEWGVPGVNEYDVESMKNTDLLRQGEELLRKGLELQRIQQQEMQRAQEELRKQEEERLKKEREEEQKRIFEERQREQERIKKALEDRRKEVEEKRKKDEEMRRAEATKVAVELQTELTKNLDICEEAVKRLTKCVEPMLETAQSKEPISDDETLKIAGEFDKIIVEVR